MLDRTVPPSFVKSSSFALITPEEKSLPNGMQLFFVPGGFQDVVKIEFIFEAGRWFEEKTGTAYFTAQLLSKGTQRRNSFDIAQLFDRYGAHLEVNPGLDFVSISLYALTKNLAPVLEVLTEILSNPTFPDKELGQTQSVYIQNLKVNNEKTSYVASRVFRKNLFGGHHPYGSEAEEDDVQKILVKNLHDHFKNFFHSARVFVSGRFEAVHKKLMVERFGQLAPAKTHSSISHSITVKPGHQRVKKGESVQASVRTGKRSLLRSHPDYISALFVSHILGGYFGSRLMKNIREERGLTYGISASLHALRNDSFLVVGADVNKENVELTFDEVRRELRRMRTTMISTGELETTRNHFIGSLQSEMTTPFAHADKIKTISLFQLEKDHYQRMIKRIDNITPSDIAAISERYFHEDTFYEVAVG